MTSFSLKASPSGTIVSEIAHDPNSGFKLVVETPVNGSNFKEYNRTMDAIDATCLSQPINDAQYDSETQACIDLLSSEIKEGSPPSFYDHFVTPSFKKKNIKVVTLEEPAVVWDRAPPPPDSSCGSSTCESCTCGWAIPPQGKQSTPSSMDFLTVPPQLEVPEQRCTDGGHELLDNPEIRRLATGAMPPHSIAL